MLTALLSGCAQTQNAKVDSRYELQLTVENFHRDLRWEEFERASEVIHPSFQNKFLGRYRDYGDDLDIVNLEIKSIESEATDRKIVEVEQKWVVEPDMTVNEKRFVEVWRRSENGWFLRRRMRKTEWERRRESDRNSETDRRETSDRETANDRTKRSARKRR